MALILDKIVRHKKAEVQALKEMTSIKALEQRSYFETATVSFRAAIMDPQSPGVVAEFKRKSPSKPQINLDADPVEVSVGYRQSGASAISVLTDQSFFGGYPHDLQTVKDNNPCPVLRKDFIIDEYQIIEAKSIGADAILLISEILSTAEVIQFAQVAHSLGLEVLLELHHEDHIDKVGSHIDVLGVNNRDLSTFQTDIENSIRLLDSLPHELVKISESGIHCPEQAALLAAAGYDGFLIGELFMKDSNPADACKRFIDALKERKG